MAAGVAAPAARPAPAARAALWGYYATGFAFMLWGFLRWLPVADGLVAVDARHRDGVGALRGRLRGPSTAAVARRRPSRSVEPALAAAGAGARGREATGLSARLDHAPPPSVRGHPEGVLSARGPVDLPNVYHRPPRRVPGRAVRALPPARGPGGAPRRLRARAAGLADAAHDERAPLILTGRWALEPRNGLGMRSAARTACSGTSGGRDTARSGSCPACIYRLDTLRRLGRLDDSVVVIHGDHGSGYTLKDGRLVALTRRAISGRSSWPSRPARAARCAQGSGRPASSSIAPHHPRARGSPPGRGSC